MTHPVAIYRPRTRELLLANAEQSILVDEDRVPRLVRALRGVIPMIGPRSTVRIRNPTGLLSVTRAELAALADDMEHAFSVPEHAAALAAIPVT